MLKYVYILTVLMLAFGTYIQADEAMICKEGQVLDPVKKVCVDAPKVDAAKMDAPKIDTPVVDKPAVK
jgi:hypothetical protein